MGKVIVHPRIAERHPEISERDALDAMEGMVRYIQRDDDKYIAVGFDRRGRLIEMVYALEGERFLVYHAMTPPSAKTIAELKLSR